MAGSARESKDLASLDEILAVIGDGIWMTDASDCIRYFNPAMEQIAGVSAADMLGLNVTRDFPNETTSRIVEFYFEARKKLQPAAYEAPVVTPSGRQTIQAGWLSPLVRDGVFAGMVCTIHDVTTERSLAQALEESEARHRALFESASVGIGYFNVDGDLLAVNREAASRMGSTPEVLVGKNVREFSQNPKVTLQRLEKAAASNESTRYEDETMRNGELQSVVRTYTALRNIDGIVNGIQVIANDISEIRRAEKARVDAEQRSRAILDTVPDLLFWLDTDGKYVDVRGPKDALFLPPEEFLGRHFTEVLPTRASEAISAGFEALLANGQPQTVEYTLEMPSGTRHYEARLASLEYEGVLAIVRDISEQYEAQERLRESEERYRSIVQSSPVGILTVDATGRVATCNPAFLKMNGMEKDEIVGVHFTKLPTAHLRDLPKYVRMFRSLATGHDPAPFEASWTTPDGIEHHGEIRARIIRGSKRRWSVHVMVLDITDRMRAQKALAESEARYRSLFENAALGIYRTTPDGRILAANDALLQMLGYDSFEQLAERNLEDDAWYESETPRSQFRDLVEQSEVLSGLESAWKRRDGSTVYVREHARAIRDGAGDVICYEGTLEDVTEKRQMQHSLELTQFSIDSTHVMILWIDAPGRIIYANRAAADMLGYDLDALRDMHVWDIQRDYPRERRSELRERLKDGEPVSETTFTRRDGTTYPVELSAQYIEFRGNEYEFVVATDITDRAAAETALRESEENYRTIFNSANDAIVIHDAQTGEVLDANRRAEEMFGYSATALTRLSVSDVSDGETPYSAEEAVAFIREAARGGMQIFEWRSRRASGELFWSEVNLRAVTLLGRDVVLAVVRDITERKELEAKLWQSQRLESIGTLASGVAHEINNPLMGMINYAELIASRTEDDTLRGFSQEIKVEGHRVAKIVRNLLSFARQDREQHSPARLCDIVDASLSIIGSLLRRDFVLIDLQVPEDLPNVRCRSQQIQQILINLLTNARDSLNARYPAADERKTLRVTGEAIEDESGRWLRTAVEDAGVGIPKDVIDRVFDPFFTTKGRDKGTGLGLSISYGIARDHGGRLSVESDADKGTRFLLDLPLHEHAESNEDDAS